MDKTKPWWQSAGVLGCIGAMAAGAASLAGYTLTPDDQAQIAQGVAKSAQIATSAFGLLSSAIALWGRVRATHKIG